jgi:hypothetical protein
LNPIDLPSDDSGYALTPDDLEYLQIDFESAARAVAKVAPLGMSEHQYGGFVQTLLDAVWREGFNSADIRLQGSSVRFFSGPHKVMPYSRAEIFNAFMDEQEIGPDGMQLTAIEHELERWPESSRPMRRPFDALYRVGVALERSDYDVQISTDSAFEIVRSLLVRRGLDPGEIAIDNEKYQFMKKALSEGEFLQLERWRAQWMTRLGRPISIAVFDGRGPRRAPENPVLSSHFKETDWVVHIGRVAPEGRAEEASHAEPVA